MKFVKLLPALVLFAANCTLFSGTESNQPEIVGTAKGIEITREQMEEAAREQLQKLEMERRQFEARQKIKRQEILEQTVRQMLVDEMIALEAGARQVSREEILAAEVQAKISEPTEEEVERFYEANKDRVRGSKEELLPQIKNFLLQQRQQQAYQALLTRLDAGYGPEVKLEPLRFQVESDGFPSQGPADAPVVLVEFSDFQCPYCQQYSKTVQRVMEEYEGKVRRVFRQFPIASIHPEAVKAAEASLCAADQGKFWEMYETLFENPRNLSPRELSDKARALDLNVEAFDQCLQSDKYEEQVQEDLLAGAGLGVTGTPASFVNGRFVNGAVPYEQLVQIIQEELDRAH